MNQHSNSRNRIKENKKSHLVNCHILKYKQREAKHIEQKGTAILKMKQEMRKI